MPQQDDYNRRSRSLMVVAGADESWSVPPGEPGMPAPGDLISDKYRIDRMVGRGGMGAVFRATHVLMDKPVAVKWMTPELGANQEARERFAREARAAARISHPNVVDVYDVGTQGSALYMVMELLEGESFEALVTRGDVPIAQMLHLLVQAMRGVAAAHAQGVVHRDIKPDNVFISMDATQPSGMIAKVLDFGISKLAEDLPDKAGLTKSGMTMGTPAYMSLEQMNGARDVDARADVYSFGVLLYRALTGRLPFDGETFGAVAVAIATHSPPTPRQLRPELPQALDQIVMRAIARNRDQRFGTLQELIDALQSLETNAGHVPQVNRPPMARAPALTPVSRERPRVEIERSVVFDPEYETPLRQNGGGARWLILALCLVGLAYLAWRWTTEPVDAPELAPSPLAPPVADPVVPAPPSAPTLQLPPEKADAPETAPPAAGTEPGGLAPLEKPRDEPADERPAEAVEDVAEAPAAAEAALPDKVVPEADVPAALPEASAAPEVSAPRRKSRPRRSRAAPTAEAPAKTPDDDAPARAPDNEAPARAPEVESTPKAPPQATGEQQPTEDPSGEADESEALPKDHSSHRSGGVRWEDL